MKEFEEAKLKVMTFGNNVIATSGEECTCDGEVCPSFGVDYCGEQGDPW